MIRITCPCCSQRYELEDEEIEENLRFFCWNCNKKLIYVRGKIIPFALEQPAQGGSRKIRCPFCSGKNPMDEEDNGVFICRSCGHSFYVLPSNGVPPPLPSELAQTPIAEPAEQHPCQPEKPPVVSPSTPTESIPRMQADVPPPVPAGNLNTIPPIPLAGKAQGIPVPQTSAPPQSGKPVNKLLDFSKENREMFFAGGSNTKIKVGLPRPRSGISGFFIGISEALCGKR